MGGSHRCFWAAVPWRRSVRATIPDAQQVATLSTAQAVERVMAEEGTAAVAPPRAAELLGGVVHATGVQDDPRNSTRFVLPGEGGRIDQWNQSAMIAAERATQCWVRVASDRNLGAYELFEAPADLPDPEWPEISFQEILNIAFRGRQIDDINHSVLKQLRGEI